MILHDPPGTKARITFSSESSAAHAERSQMLRSIAARMGTVYRNSGSARRRFEAKRSAFTAIARASPRTGVGNSADETTQIHRKPRRPEGRWRARNWPFLPTALGPAAYSAGPEPAPRTFAANRAGTGRISTSTCAIAELLQFRHTRHISSRGEFRVLSVS